MNDMSLRRRDWPEVGELVVTTVKSLEGYGAYVSLDEYEGREGLLHISEISSRWVRNIRNHVRQGQKVVLQVLRVDSSKRHVDLSLRRVSRDERRKKIESWKKTRKAETLLAQVASDLKMEAADLYEAEGAKIVDFYGDLYEGLEAAAKKGVDALKEAGVSDRVAGVLSEIAKEKIIVKGVTIQGTMEIISMGSRGVEEIKETLLASKKVAAEHDAVANLYILGAPKYKVEITADDYRKAEAALEKVVEYTKDVWAGHDGTVSFSRE